MLVTREELTAFAWSAPMRELAAKVGMSDVGLRKLLSSSGIALPPQGHWNRVHAGRAVPSPPEATPRGPGETGRIALDRRFEGHVPAARRLPSSGPFATAHVPEDLEELRAQQLEAIGRIATPRDLARPDPALKRVIAGEERLRAKSLDWSFYRPNFDNPVGQRMLRILNGLFAGLRRHGHGSSAQEDRGRINAQVTVGDTRVGLELRLDKDAAGYASSRLDGLPPSTRLRLSIAAGLEWTDGATRLEAMLGEIAAAIVTHGERLLRSGLRAAEEQEERWRIERERMRVERQRQRDEQREKDLLRSGELLRRAEELRSVVGRVRSAVAAGDLDVQASALEEWEAWARTRADALDPVMSRQVLSHLIRPTAD